MDDNREPSPAAGTTPAGPSHTTAAGPTPGPAAPRARWFRVADPRAEDRRHGPSEPATTGPTPTGTTGGTSWAGRLTATASGVLLASIIVAPTAMSSQEIVGWAKSPTGLHATGIWPYVAFYALDAAAVFCVLMGVYASWFRGESPGAFRIGVWTFAGMSACAQYAFAQAPDAGASSWWFYPGMSLLGPALLEVALHRIRRWVNEGRGRRARTGVQFGLTEWLPVIGHFRETFGAWRLARFVDMTTNADGTPFTGNLAARARVTYRVLCPDGSLRVFDTLRKRQAAAMASLDIVLPGLVPVDMIASAPAPFRLQVDVVPEPAQLAPAPTPAAVGPAVGPQPGGLPKSWGPDPRDTADQGEPTTDQDGPTGPGDQGPAAGVKITQDEVDRLLTKHAAHLFAIRDGYGLDADRADWLACTPAISRRGIAALLGIPDGRAARELHTCMTHLRADRASVAKIPATGA